MAPTQERIEPQTITVKTVAQRTGAAESTVQSWCRRGILKSTRIGRTYFIRPSDLDELLTHGWPSR